jgi:solute carrier family 25 carnitine/acylcarnitine transporter 20/29
VFSGIAKLSVGHPFDTIKVRLQTSTKQQFKGPVDCLMQTLRKEGVNGIYKGATPPLIGWMCMDSVMLGSLTLYRRLLNEHVFQPLQIRPNHPVSNLSEEECKELKKLPVIGHALAGIFAGWTVSFIAAPVEHVKARLQVQYQVNKLERAYSGPVDCARKLTANHGIHGLYHGLFATLIFRTFFCFWWGSYDVFTRYFEKNTNLSAPAVNFWAGGLSAQVFWLTSYPSDVVC